jgi:hypothetical protein
MHRRHQFGSVKVEAILDHLNLSPAFETIDEIAENFEISPTKSSVLQIESKEILKAF